MSAWGYRAIASLEGRRSIAAETTKPNIVYIVADDLGWKDVGFHSSDIKTPNIDKLAQTGARLEQFYARPMCTPTRAALMTGRYPGKSDAFDKALAAFSVAYADQNEKDHAALKRVIGNGKIDAAFD